jgi:spore coat polysaccharide biosynthesis predicted glycosyltransferase SpsG
MKVYFLTEYSKNVGFGHVSRCSSLADAFLQKGYEVVFLIREWKDEPLELAYPKERIEWKDLDQLKAIVPKEDLIVFDSYRVEKEVLDKIAIQYDHIVSIADSKLNYANNGVVVIGSIYGREMDFSFSVNETEFLAGPEYVLFRKIFWDIEKRKLKEHIDTVLISLGGHANRKVLEKVIAILSIHMNAARIKILGNAAIEISERVENLGFLNPSDLLEEYKEADLVITNGGQSLNEVILLGIPAIGISVVDNQDRNLKTWNKLGVLKNYINANSVEFQDVLEDSVKEIEDLASRMEHTARGIDIVDFRGATRVVEHIEKKWN